MTPQTLTHAARFAVFTGVQPFVPPLLDTHFSGGRVQIQESVWNRSVRRRLGPLGAAGLAACAIAVGLAAWGAVGLIRRREWRPTLTLLLVAGLYATYAGMAVAGRMNLRPGPYILSANCYYAYPGLLLILVTLAAGWRGLPAADPVRRGLAVLLTAVALAGGEQVRQVNEAVARDLLEVTRPAKAVGAFVRAHRHEPGFSFAIDRAASDPEYVIYDRPATDILFHQWIDRTNPRYRLAVRDGKVVPLGEPRP